MKKKINFSDFKGKKFKNIAVEHQQIVFADSSGKIYQMYHEQDCCESVTVDDVCGDIEDLLHSEILEAQEISNCGKFAQGDDEDGSYTWTFYHLSTIKGSVTIKWYGSSNGYYSESVDVYELEL